MRKPFAFSRRSFWEEEQFHSYTAQGSERVFPKSREEQAKLIKRQLPTAVYIAGVFAMLGITVILAAAAF